MKKKSSVSMNDISTWGWPISTLFGLIIITVILYVANAFLVSDITKQVEKINSAVTKVEKKYLANMKILAILPQIREEVLQLVSARDNAKKFLPTEVSMPSLIDDVYASARKNGIIFTSFAPSSDIDTPYYTIKPISLSANIGYISMADFIEEVTALKRIMNIHSVSFRSEQKTPEAEENLPLQMTAELRTYIFKE